MFDALEQLAPPRGPRGLRSVREDLPAVDLRPAGLSDAAFVRHHIREDVNRALR